MPSTRLKAQMPVFYEILNLRWEALVPTLHCAAQARCAQAVEGAVKRTKHSGHFVLIVPETPGTCEADSYNRFLEKH